MCEIFPNSFRISSVFIRHLVFNDVRPDFHPVFQSFILISAKNCFSWYTYCAKQSFPSQYIVQSNFSHKAAYVSSVRYRLVESKWIFSKGTTGPSASIYAAGVFVFIKQKKKKTTIYLLNKLIMRSSETLLSLYLMFSVVRQKVL